MASTGDLVLFVCWVIRTLLTALKLSNMLRAVRQKKVLPWSTRLTIGGFGAHTGHDAHILNTLSAVQLLAIEDALDTIDHEKVIKCTTSHYRN